MYVTLSYIEGLIVLVITIQFVSFLRVLKLCKFGITRVVNNNFKILNYTNSMTGVFVYTAHGNLSGNLYL